MPRPSPRRRKLVRPQRAGGTALISQEMQIGADVVLEKSLAAEDNLIGLEALRTLNFDDAGTCFRKSNTRSHLKGLAVAYALYVRAQSNQGLGAIISTYAEQRRLRSNKRTELIHLVVETVMAYGTTSAEERKAMRRLYNRDVQAIRHLIDRQVSPDEVEALGTKKGEGINAWSRGSCRSQSISGAKALPNAETKTELVWKVGGVTVETIVVPDDDASQNVLANVMTILANLPRRQDGVVSSQAGSKRRPVEVSRSRVKSS